MMLKQYASASVLASTVLQAVDLSLHGALSRPVIHVQVL